MAEPDLVCGVGDGLCRGRAGPVERVCGDRARELRQQADLARHVRRQHRRHDLAQDDLVDECTVELRPIEQLARGVPGHGHARRVAEDGAAAGEGRAKARDDRDATVGHWEGHADGAPLDFVNRSCAHTRWPRGASALYRRARRPRAHALSRTAQPGGRARRAAAGVHRRWDPIPVRAGWSGNSPR